MRVCVYECVCEEGVCIVCDVHAMFVCGGVYMRVCAIFVCVCVWCAHRVCVCRGPCVCVW